MSKRTAKSSRHPITLVALLALLVPLVQAQNRSSGGSARLQGKVCDSHNRPLAGATVSLESSDLRQTFVANTDSQGHYSFQALPSGTYTLRANLPGYAERTKGPLVFKQNQAMTIDLQLEPTEGSETGKGTGQTIDFSDEPQFTVAGVTDPSNLGGHGSDVVMRTKEALAKDTVSLSQGKSTPSNVPETISPETKSPAETGEGTSKDFLEEKRRGELLLEAGKPQQALPYLERANRLKPDDPDGAYALSLAYDQVGDLDHANQMLRALLAHEDRADFHALLGDISEKQAHPLEAVREYQRAAEMEPTEPHLFAWGAELLLHRALEPATEVFTKGHRLFPRSTRMLEGLGVASYSRGSYEQATQQLLEACDVDPGDPQPYLFLGKIQDAEKIEPPGWAERLKRFAALQPDNAFANYLYAVALTKQSKGSENSGQVESLLQRAIFLDPHLGSAHLQLGILYAQRKDFPRAISAYKKAIENTPLPEEAHFRLAQAYRQTGEIEKAREEIELYNQITQQTSQEAERQRHEIQQFVYTLRGQTAPSQRPGSTP